MPDEVLQSTWLMMTLINIFPAHPVTGPPRKSSRCGSAAVGCAAPACRAVKLGNADSMVEIVSR